MQERQVTIGRESYALPEPFLVMATQNPIESDGTYPLPEAQVDRFMLKVLVDYPSATEEFVIVERMVAGLDRIQEAMGVAELRESSRRSAPSSSIRLSSSTRSRSRPRREISSSDWATWRDTSITGPAPGIDYMVLAAALALVRGRDYVLPEDVRTIAPDVLRHRLVLSYEALADGVGAEHIIDMVLGRVPVPDVVLRITTS